MHLFYACQLCTFYTETAYKLIRQTVPACRFYLMRLPQFFYPKQTYPESVARPKPLLIMTSRPKSALIRQTSVVLWGCHINLNCALGFPDPFGWAFGVPRKTFLTLEAALGFGIIFYFQKNRTHFIRFFQEII